MRLRSHVACVLGVVALMMAAPAFAQAPADPQADPQYDPAAPADPQATDPAAQDPAVTDPAAQDPATEEPTMDREGELPATASFLPALSLLGLSGVAASLWLRVRSRRRS